MTTHAPVLLGAGEVPFDRRFAHPDHVAADRATIDMLVADYRRHLADIEDAREPVIHYVPDESDWFRRVMLPRPAAAAARSEFTVVGFFGRRRLEISQDDSATLADLGRRLDAAIPRAEGVLGYTTHLLVDELNYANLVVLDSPADIRCWRDMKPHPFAAEGLSPGVYEHVRIYNGSVALRSHEPADHELTLNCVKYWDYRRQPVWHAVRELA